MTKNARQSVVLVESVVGSITQTVNEIIVGNLDEYRSLRNRQALLNMVTSFWIEGVLDKSLQRMVTVEVGLETKPDAVAYVWDLVLQPRGLEAKHLPRGADISEIFRYADQSLLILGEPGSGKTTLLLELARAAIKDANNDPSQRIPVVFNLSSWSTTRPPLAEWLIQEMNVRYRVPERVGRVWVEHDDLLLLLDGLDEVALQHQAACIAAINTFRQAHGFTPIAVCSRLEDYERLDSLLALESAVVIQPIADEEIEQALASLAQQTPAATDLLRSDPILRSLARTPLMLNVLALTINGLATQATSRFDTKEAYRRVLFDTYIQEMFRRRGGGSQYTPEQSLQWLGWLARNMFRHNLTVFSPDQLQPTWLLSVRWQRRYSYLARLVPGLFLALLLTLGLTVASGRLSGLFFSLVLSALTIGLIDIFRGSQSRNIYMARPFRFDLRRLLRPARLAAIVGFLLGVIPGLLLGLIYWEHFPSPTKSLSDAVIIVLSVMLLASISGSVFLLLLALLFGSMRKSTVSYDRGSTSGPWLTVANCAGVVTGIIVGPLFLFGDRTALLVFLPPAIVAGSWFGGMDLVRLAVLRSILALTNQAPWRLGSFLDYASERVLLQQVGGGYRFVHRLFLEHIAGMDR